MIKIKSIAQLKTLIRNGQNEFALIFCGGAISRKWIFERRPGRYNIVHCIDASHETVSEAELLRDTNVGEALCKGALFLCEE